MGLLLFSSYLTSLASLSLVCRPCRLWWNHGLQELLLTLSRFSPLDNLLLARRVKQTDTMEE